MNHIDSSQFASHHQKIWEQNSNNNYEGTLAMGRWHPDPSLMGPYK